MKIPLSLFLQCYIVVLFSINIQGQSVNNQYTIIKEDDIYVEQFDSTYRSDDRFTENNQIYKENRTFIYTYQYLNKQGQAFLYQKYHIHPMKMQKKPGNLCRSRSKMIQL